MKAVKTTNCIKHSLENLMPIVSVEASGAYAISLPSSLQSEQHELEQMLNRLFAGHLNSPCNVDLAQQLSLNWCATKLKLGGN
jgi:hypothetical protein